MLPRILQQSPPVSPEMFYENLNAVNILQTQTSTSLHAGVWRTQVLAVPEQQKTAGITLHDTEASFLFFFFCPPNTELYFFNLGLFRKQIMSRKFGGINIAIVTKLYSSKSGHLRCVFNTIHSCSWSLVLGVDIQSCKKIHCTLVGCIQSMVLPHS